MLGQVVIQGIIRPQLIGPEPKLRLQNEWPGYCR